MANHVGAAGAKFVSVNLNKSYGQPAHHNNYPPYSGSYGPAAANRSRAGGHASGGGMVVLSRNRPLQKAVSKLSVPPPLNLPSLRKEHEKLDLSGSGGSAAGASGTGSGSRPSSSGMGWTKPGTVALQEKEGNADIPVAESVSEAEGIAKVNNGTYMPPSARLGRALGQPTATSAQSYPPLVEKAMVLRGEDFPSLRAALPTSMPGQKQDSSSQKQKIEPLHEHRDPLHLTSPVRTHQQAQSSPHTTSEPSDNGRLSHKFGSARTADQSLKQEDPLPLIWMNPRSDWADDERDTGHGFAERTRDYGLPKSEAFWERDFDMPRRSILPHKPPISERRGLHTGEIGKGSSTELLKLDPYQKDLSREDREINTWRNSSIQKGASHLQEGISEKSATSRSAGLTRDVGRDSKYIPPSFGDNARQGVTTGHWDSSSGRRDMGHGLQGGQQHWTQAVEPFSGRGAERNMRDRHGNDQSIRHWGDAYQNPAAYKSSFSSGAKGLPISDPLLNFGREKRAFSKSERSYVEDPYLKDFSSGVYDENDPFAGNLVGVVKRKRDTVKQADFHDPVRESFEAELERVQKMQEVERQRVIEEQEKALEQARKEEEERQRLIREEEEQQRKIEEEAREAVWREEQERLEAIRKAEEQKIAREEEKRRIFIEEERRKQAAKQKLLELEAKMAKRQAEVPKSDSSINTAADEEISASEKDKDLSMAADLDNWEDSERMVERITSAGSDSSILNRPFDRPHPTREGSSSVVDRGKPLSPWRRDAFENGSNSSFLLHDQENGHHSPKRDSSIDGRGFFRKEFYGGAGYISSRNSFKGGMQEHHADGFPHFRDSRWSPSGDGDPYTRNRDYESEFYDNVAEKYDIGWGQGHSRGSTRSPYSDRLYLTSEPDELYPYGRSRYSMRQPRVLPPPSLAPMPKTSLRGESEVSGPSTSVENGDKYNLAARSDSSVRTGYFSNSQEKLEQSELDVGQEIMAQKLDKNAAGRCDSQSSLSVSSPPSSPTHLSHDELDESAVSPVISTTAEGKENLLSGSEPEVLHDKSGKENVMEASNSISAGEDEEWSLENNEEMQEQEEYDEDDDAYQEEDEVHEGDDENIDLAQEFEHIHLEEKSTSDVMMDNLVLGFNEGVEVGIPGDDFERDSGNEDKFAIPEVSAGIVVEQGSAGGVRDDEQILQQVIHEPEKAVHDPPTQPLNVLHTSTSDRVRSVDGSGGSGLSGEQTSTSSVDVGVHSSSVQATMPALSSVPSQADLPIKLQFGLFSGPSLIPSPIPAIQIGSIQMPLHLHSPIGPSISHIHPSQTPLFQFGQLRYTSPVSQGILPIAPQPMPFIQSNIHTHYNMNQSSGGSLPIQSSQETSTPIIAKNDVPSLSLNNQPGVLATMPDLSHERWSRDLTGRVRPDTNVVLHNSQNGTSHAADNRNTSKPGLQAEVLGRQGAVVKNYIPSSEKGSEGPLHFASASSQSVSSEKDFTMSKAPGPLSVSKGKKNVYSVRNSGQRSSFPASEASHSGSNEFQRRPRRAIQQTEFRVRENVDWKQTAGLVSNNSGLDDKSNSKGVGTFIRSGYRRGPTSTKSFRQVAESENSPDGPSSSQESVPESRAVKVTPRQAFKRTQPVSQAGEGNLKRNIPEVDVDAPLQSGIVRVFKQPGIETPSDEDDFIEVRSKRKMLNDRREQREKEIKAKSRLMKVPRKSRSSVQGIAVSSNKISGPLEGEASNSIHSAYVASEGRGLVKKETSTGFSVIVSQPLAPIGTPAVTADVQADIRSHTSKPLQTGSSPAISNAAKDLGPNLIFEAKTKVLDNVQTSLGAWGNARIDQQVMALTQTQLDEAMKPARFDTHVTAIGDHSASVSEPILPSSALLTKDKSTASSVSPINSLLAGEKIQFGAVTSPTVLPSSSRVVSHGIGAPGSFQSDIKISQNLSKADSDCTLFFEKDKNPVETCALLDCEAEAAASAIAVAAISTDELVGNGLGSVSIPDTKSFGGADVDVIQGDGLAVDPQPESQSRPEESLSVSLPADLSVETPPISLWPTLPSPHSSSTQMLSHFPGAPPTHFPFYDMNHPMLGGPIFAFGPHEESGGTQSQSQKTNVSGSGNIGAWQHCHSAMDSFYGHHAGFTGPFISPPGGIQGVQAPPHMVVYNHYAPVGQFGQVGLSFMGATYIPSGKQPDWKHNPTSSAMGIGEGDMNAMNMVSAQRNPLTMPPIQHLAPGSPLLPMGSPLAMFDVPPFQAAPDISVQARWSHVPSSPLHSVPMSLPLQQHTEGIPPSHFSSHAHPIEQSLTSNRFSESQTSAPSDNNARAFPVVREENTTQFPDELGLVDTSTSGISPTSTQVAIGHVSSGSIISDIGKADIHRGNNNNSGNVQSLNTFKNQHPHPKNISAAQQYNHSSGGYGYQRGGPSQKNSSSGEWSQRRMGFHGRHQSLGAERNFPSAKMKQIYVAKQTSSGPSSKVG